ncbi:MAG: acyltransferase [Hymenobacter sp.]|nr:MAG: acyltransferase [Hymenobacter sp.]
MSNLSASEFNTSKSLVDVQSTPKLYLGVLDMLRGFAALSVVLYHFSMPGKQGGFLVKFYSPTLHFLFQKGNIGVEVFFVISGFIIPFSLWNTKYQITHFWHYMRKRLIRILPPAYAVILLLLLQWIIVDYLLHHNVDRISELNTKQLLSNFLFIVPFTKAQWFNGVFWTLSIELQYYFILGIVFNIIFKKDNITLFVGVNLLMFVLSYLPGLPKETFFTYSPLFALGATVLLYYKARVTFISYLLMIILWTTLSCISVGYIASIFGLMAAVCITFVKVDSRFFSFFGKISYSLYLTHILVGSTLEYIFSKLINLANDYISLIIILLITVISIYFSYLYYKWIEIPFLALAQKVKI